MVSRCVFDVRLELREPLLASSSVSTFCFGLDRAHQLVALDIELGAADVVARVQQRDLVVGRLNGRLRVGLDDLLLRELQIESRLFEVELLLGGIEFEDDVAGFEGQSRFCQLQDLELPAHRRHGQLHRARGAEIADGYTVTCTRPRCTCASRDAFGDAADTLRSTTAPAASSTAIAMRGLLDHLPAPSCSGSFSETRSPSTTPEAMAI